MHPHQQQFIDLAVRLDALKFGEFTLKSGRRSPYFFNAGAFNTGGALAQLGRCYAEAIMRSGIAFDMLFGPAYKGIPLVAATAIALADAQGRDLPYAFNRKEPKDHGEGGSIIGSPLAGRVLIVDDVITAGTAIRESTRLIEQSDATVAAIVLALDRQERGQGAQSAVQELEAALGVKCVSIITLSDVIDALAASGKPEMLAAMRDYRARYGI